MSSHYRAYSDLMYLLVVKYRACLHFKKSGSNFVLWNLFKPHWCAEQAVAFAEWTHVPSVNQRVAIWWKGGALMLTPTQTVSLDTNVWELDWAAHVFNDLKENLIEFVLPPKKSKIKNGLKQKSKVNVKPTQFCLEQNLLVWYEHQTSEKKIILSLLDYLLFFSSATKFQMKLSAFQLSLFVTCSHLPGISHSGSPCWPCAPSLDSANPQLKKCLYVQP